MRSFFHPAQAHHAPARELHNGGFADYAEVPARAAAIRAAIGATQVPTDRGEAPIAAVHDPAYLAFLRDAPRLWREAGRPGDAIPYAFPIVGRRPLAPARIDALIGLHSFDATTPITPEAWAASYGSAQSALAATHAVLAGERAAFALCRPPGHHAGRDYCGGYCHLNTAAIAAQAARDAGNARVAILDIDYHHGNGTQDIFYARGDVFYASVHADPVSDYPFFWGHADERGKGAGEGTTLNLPLPHGTRLHAFRRAQATALDAIARFGAGLLVVSFGADTWEGDPISHFALTTADYAVLARDIAALALPTVVVMEGGYAVEALGANVASFLSGL
ncbi:histone deacetylase family protein [Sphingomonas corticis]|jgi:acetoin utilization deacetylase AcuC-like enzyme|uniref:Histone deacetylase family protein n=1 Tax=Sphingomonas corticis TaxID=2722791 RepID=A0ABX1CLS4_9SPHN|nr:histone deacetylase family protein [Sphingomonas corticis]NJR77673.1 histone deacetylase family protein [Sphingomonas corticis]